MTSVVALPDVQDERPQLRILLEPSGYAGHNIGDAAMLEVALARLRSRWPRAAITIHSLDSETLNRLDPAVAVLDPSGSWGWSADAALIAPTGSIPPLISRFLDAGRLLRRRAPRVMRRVAEAALLWKRRPTALVRDYVDAIDRADLVLVTGAGSLNDVFKRHAFVVLETLERAIHAKAVTALVGQGIGPMSDPALLKRAAAILHRVDLVALRDGVGSLALIEAFDIPKTRVVVTGDDAISLAYPAGMDRLGSGIGFNLRSAPYAGLADDVVRSIGTVVCEAAVRHAAPLVAVPISRDVEHDDWETIDRIIGEHEAMIPPTRQVPPAEDGNRTSSPSGHRTDTNAKGPRTPADLLTLLPDCRIVVSGSYHAAVFALAMGIPAVTIAASDYYVQKFRGLHGQFGAACRVECTSHPSFYRRLAMAIDDAWRSAHAARAHLLHAAAHQLHSCDAAYQRLFELVDARQKLIGRKRA
jgi:colanic acid/amylovoran biosynthesis protein